MTDVNLSVELNSWGECLLRSQIKGAEVLFFHAIRLRPCPHVHVHFGKLFYAFLPFIHTCRVNIFSNLVPALTHGQINQRFYLLYHQRCARFSSFWHQTVCCVIVCWFLIILHCHLLLLTVFETVFWVSDCIFFSQNKCRNVLILKSTCAHVYNSPLRISAQDISSFAVQSQKLGVSFVYSVL